MTLEPVLIVALTILAIALLLYAGVDRDRAVAAKPKRPADRVPRRDGDSSPPEGDFSSPSGADRPPSPLSGPGSAALEGLLPDFQEFIQQGIAGIFSLPASPPVQVPTSLGIGDISEEVRQRVSAHIDTLKDFSSVHRLQRLMGDPQSNLADLSLLITSNPLLSAKVLQIANSSYYGMEQKINSISHAIMIIGMVNIKAILYQEAVLQALNEKSFRNNAAALAIWQHSNYASIYSSYLHYLFEGLNMGTLFTLGLLHDIGKLIMLKLPPVAGALEAIAEGTGAPATFAEEERRFGINHALVGQMALQHWGLSPLIVNSVALHHAPACDAADSLGLGQDEIRYLLVLFLADQAAHLFSRRDHEGDPSVAMLHPSFHPLIDRHKLFQLVVDKSLLSQLRESEALTGISG